ncbi:hypothetical protein Tco_1359550 [Tanacetum coccineum]
MSSMGELHFLVGGLQVKQRLLLLLNLINHWSRMKMLDVHVYRSMIGSLMYLTASRPDIMFVVVPVLGFKSLQKLHTYTAVNRIFCDYGWCRLIEYSTNVALIILRSEIDIWQFKKVTIVANSTNEADIMLQFTTEEGLQAISATIDGHEKLITKDSLRRHLKSFLHQWKFFIHTILHCLSSKKTAWDQFSSNIATTLICLATSRRFNFSKFIFEAMVKNLDSPHKFLLVKKLEYNLKSGKARRKAKIVLFDDEELVGYFLDSTGRGSLRNTGDEIEVLVQEETPTEIIEETWKVVKRKMEEEERNQFNAEQEARALKKKKEERLNLMQLGEIARRLDQRQRFCSEKILLNQVKRNFKNMRKEEEEHVDKQGQDNSKRQKKEKETTDYEEEKIELRMWLTVVPDEEAIVDPEVLHTKFPIVDWESQVLGNSIFTMIHKE